MKMQTLKEQLKINKGTRFWLNDLIIITSTPYMISNYISFEYHSPYWTKKSVEHLSLSNDLQNWRWFKGINEKGCATVLYQLWKEVDGELVEILIPYEDSPPYKYRFKEVS